MGLTVYINAMRLYCCSHALSSLKLIASLGPQAMTWLYSPVMMDADPNRQWFVYDREKEQGPFSEKELKQKIVAHEFSKEAYVYTEGMPDWALITETKVLDGSAELEVELKDPSIEVLSSPSTSEELKVGALKNEADFNQQGLPIRKTSKLSLRNLISLKKASLLLIGGLLIVFLRDPIFAFFGSFKTQAPLEETSTGTNPLNNSKEAWKSLENFRAQPSGKHSSAFMIDTQNLDLNFPVIRGAISSMLPLQKISVAVFPDPEKHLMAVPALWRVEVPVFNGYFSIGPLVLPNEKQLPPGRWVVMAAHEGTFLGEVSFESGAWPSQPELVRYRERMVAQTQEMATSEIDALKAKVKELEAAATQLRQNGRLAESGKQTRKAWMVFFNQWDGKLQLALEDQRKVLAGPMFFAEDQSLLLKALEELSKTAQGLEVLSTGGPRSLRAKFSMTPQQLWIEFGRQERPLYDKVATLKVDTELAPLTLDREIVRQQLLEK